jgi:hypothetical protein
MSLAFSFPVPYACIIPLCVSSSLLGWRAHSDRPPAARRTVALSPRSHRPPPSSACRCFDRAHISKCLAAIEPGDLPSNRFRCWCPTVPSPSLRVAPDLWPYSREPTAAAARCNQTNGFHKTCFFQGVNLPFLRLQRTRDRTMRPVG